MSEFPFATVSFQTPMSSIFKWQQAGDIWKHIVALTVGGGLAESKISLLLGSLAAHRLAMKEGLKQRSFGGCSQLGIPFLDSTYINHVWY